MNYSPNKEKRMDFFFRLTFLILAFSALKQKKEPFNFSTQFSKKKKDKPDFLVVRVQHGGQLSPRARQPLQLQGLAAEVAAQDAVLLAGGLGSKEGGRKRLWWRMLARGDFFPSIDKEAISIFLFFLQKFFHCCVVNSDIQITSTQDLKKNKIKSKLSLVFPPGFLYPSAYTYVLSQGQSRG